MIPCIILAACGIAALLGYGQQQHVPDLPKPVPFHGGTDDAKIWAAALREKVMAGSAARPGATVVQFPGAAS
jgi:hypothetical protein